MTFTNLQLVSPRVLGTALVAGLVASSATASDWRNILPMNAPGCAADTPYSFWARAGNPEKLAVILPGGGACWSGDSCDATSEHSNYDSDASLDDDPSNEGGIFDFANAENPLLDYSFVLLPTCNGDVFLGDSVVDYTAEADDGTTRDYQVKHKGYANAMTAINWAQSEFAGAKDITVMGWSAGAIPSPLYAHIMAQKFPEARVSHMADGAGGYRVDGRLDQAFENWNTAGVFAQVPGFEDLSTQNLSFEEIYIRAAELNPDINFHQLNIAHDYTQDRFLRALGVEDPNILERITGAQAYINSKVDNFRSYTIGGDGENIIGGYYDGFLNHSLQNNGKPYMLDRLYTYQSNGVPVLDWINAAVAHENVENILCDNCDTPEYTVVFEDEH